MVPLAAAPAWVRQAAGAAPGLRADILGVRDGQPHVVAIHAGNRQRPLAVLKRYDGAAGRHAVAVMRTLGLALARVDRPALRLPDVQRWDARRGVLTQSPAPGQPLLPLLESARRPQALEAAARALACLHAVPARAGRVTTMADHLADLVRPASGRLDDVLPALQPRIDAVVAALSSWDGARRQPRAVPIHRDAHARQMFLRGQQVCLVDWDLAASGDAALDVANFAIYLRTHLSGDADAAGAAFLSAYAVHGGDLAARLPAFTALTCVRLLCKAARQQRPGWRARARRLLDQAERAL